jgi:hypothetical protein
MTHWSSESDNLEQAWDVGLRECASTLGPPDFAKVTKYVGGYDGCSAAFRDRMAVVSRHLIPKAMTGLGRIQEYFTFVMQVHGGRYINTDIVWGLFSLLLEVSEIRLEALHTRALVPT